MVISRGFLVKVGLKKGATWGTAIDCDVAGQGIQMLTEGISSASNLLDDESLTGTADQEPGVTSSQTFTGTIEANMQYSSPVLSTLIAMAMGRADSPVSPLGISSGSEKPYPYYMSYRLGDNVEGYFVSLCIDKQASSKIHEYDSVKVNGMTITGAAGEFVKISFDLIARKLNVDTTTTTTLAAATVSTPKKFVRFEDFQFRLAAASGGALAAGNQIYPTSFSITLNNNLVGDLTSLNAPYVDEPIRDAAREITGSFEIPKYEDTTIETQFLGNTTTKMDIRARSTDQIIEAGGGPYYYAFEMFMPAVLISDAQRPVTGFSKVPAPFSFTAKKVVASAPDGMDGNGNLSTLSNEEAKASITDSLRIEAMNTLKSDPLA
tara:strand:- start:1637 stop:2770 length:1134 start_codon:yes stop_codon:yes gene_type:complete